MLQGDCSLAISPLGMLSYDLSSAAACLLNQNQTPKAGTRDLDLSTPLEDREVRSFRQRNVILASMASSPTNPRHVTQRQEPTWGENQVSAGVSPPLLWGV